MLSTATCLITVVFSLCCGSCATGPAPVDQDALSWPVCQPLVNGEVVTIEVIRINGQPTPGGALGTAIEGFSRCVAGQVRTVEGEGVELDIAGHGALTRRQLWSAMRRRKEQGPSAITVVLAPALDFSDEPASGRSYYRRSGGVRHVIVVNARAVAQSAAKASPQQETDVWRVAIQRELCRLLGVPSDRSHTFADRHCTHPECILYPTGDELPSESPAPRLANPPDLCKACRREIARAHAAAGGKLAAPAGPQNRMEFHDALVQLNPDRARAYEQRAEVRWRRRDYPGAMEDVNKAIELDPDTPELYMQRGDAYRSMGQFASAVPDYEMTIRLDGSSQLFLNHFAWFLATCPDESARDGKRAVKLATKACELDDWQDAERLDTLAAAYAEVGDFDSAVEYQTKAISLADRAHVKQFTERRELYRTGKPHHETDP